MFPSTVSSKEIHININFVSEQNSRFRIFSTVDANSGYRQRGKKRATFQNLLSYKQVHD